MKAFLTTSFFLLIFSCSVFGQSRSYWAGGMDMNFSFADVEANGVKGDVLMRWAPVVNIHSYYNMDISTKFGFFTGLGISNVGYIYDNYTEPSTGNVYKKKFRSYNLGIPVALKFGDMSNWCLYAGYEVEFPFVYKEKTFDSDDKISKITGWFSDRQNSFQHGPFIGVWLPDGGTIKFKYYISEFHNQDFTDASGNQPYAGLKSNIFYFSVGYLLEK